LVLGSWEATSGLRTAEEGKKNTVKEEEYRLRSLSGVRSTEETIEEAEWKIGEKFQSQSPTWKGVLTSKGPVQPRRKEAQESRFRLASLGSIEEEGKPWGGWRMAHQDQEKNATPIKKEGRKKNKLYSCLLLRTFTHVLGVPKEGGPAPGLKRELRLLVKTIGLSIRGKRKLLKVNYSGYLAKPSKT